MAALAAAALATLLERRRRDAALCDREVQQRVITSAPGEWTPTHQYEEMDVCGWTVHVAPALQAGGVSAALGSDALALLRSQLDLVSRFVPEAPLAKMRRAHIWIDVAASYDPGMATYHWSADWLRE